MSHATSLSPAAGAAEDPSLDGTADLERRFAGLSRLYGPQAPARLRAARVAVVGVGGVGSWAAEALARCGVGGLILVDLDHVAESNVNRQIHALSDTLGQAKVQAMAARIAGINPHCAVQAVDDFLTPDNAAQVLAPAIDVVIDCTDQMAAKIAMVLLARQRRQPLLVCGGAGGKTDPLALRAGDLSESTHDALLAKLRNVLRKQHGYAKPPARAGKPGRVPRMGVRVLWFEQAAILPSAWMESATAKPGSSPALAPGADEAPLAAPHAALDNVPDAGPLQGLSCAGYGSVVTVTAAMGMAAADQALRQVLTAR